MEWLYVLLFVVIFALTSWGGVVISDLMLVFILARRKLRDPMGIKKNASPREVVSALENVFFVPGKGSLIAYKSNGRYGFTLCRNDQIARETIFQNELLDPDFEGHIVPFTISEV